jgi:hypothetical protein
MPTRQRNGPTRQRNGLRALLFLGTFVPAVADPRIASDTFPVRSEGTLLVDGGLALGFPAALPTGLARGVGAGISVGAGPLRWGVRAAWLTATESTLAWKVTHQDVQLRALVGLAHVAGRGTIGIRIGAGGTLVHESRSHPQAGRVDDVPEMTALALLPAADLEGTVGLAIYGAWQLSIAGGPSLALVDGDPRWSWGARIGIGWQR